MLIFLIVSCGDYQTIPQEHEGWKVKRKNALFADDGYLNLAGLYPIQNGRYTIGSLSDKDIHVPSDLSENLGEVLVNDSIISFTFNENVLLNDSLEIREITYNHIKNKFLFSLGSFIWFVHFDSGVKAIRLRNLNHPLLGTDLNIDFFDYSKKYVIKGRFEEYNNPKIVRLNNIQGGEFVDTIPGKIHFKINGKDFSLEPTIADSGKFFVVFGDKTNGRETYGGGRFLYILQPDEENNVVIDFNKSYNPPCVFSTFTTCPVPSETNKLNIKIESGEKNYNGILFSSAYQ